MIKNVILDVGDVLLSYRWREMLTDHGLTKEDAEKIGNLMFEDELWHILDLETMTRDEVVQAYQKKYPEYADVMEWFITHGEYMHVARKDVWDKVRELKEQGYKIYILSNYSQDLFEKHTRDADFIEYADGIVVSYQIHIAKPDERIYRYLLDKYSLDAGECIFFDDRSENTAAAEKLGISTVTVTSKEQLLYELDRLMQ